ncbi:MAG: thiamine pyrophosphate-dependent enzyme, partial [Alphaproteobacteria bacterium]|nr:thiamine pyrophosphate-dependent enzyme [Alphaproteobacteria bacterium]
DVYKRQLWNLPILFVIENNKYGMGTSIERSSAHPEELHNRGNAYGINGEKIDGMDIIAVHDAVAKARRQILKNKTPFILEAMTYRYRGHSMSDPAKYRSRSEVEEVRRQRDPIERFAQRLADAGIADEKILKNIDAEVKTEVNAATENAKNSPEPAPAELWTDIYNTNNQHNLIRVGENGAFAVPVNSADSP